MPLKHLKVSAKSDPADTTLVRPSDWNADHAASGIIDWSAGVTLKMDTETVGKWNNIRIVDGVKYALTAAGIQSALNDQSAAGGGTVIIMPGGALSIYTGNPLTVSGSPIAMGSTTLTIPSHVVLRGSAVHSGTVLRWTATPTGAHSAGIALAAGTQYAGVENLTLSFSSGAAAPVGIGADANALNITAWNVFRDIFVNFETLVSGSAAVFVQSSGFNFFNNVFDNINVHLAAQALVITNGEGNFYKVNAFDCGNGAITVFQQTTCNDEIIDARIESGSSSNGINGICYSNSGQGCMVRLTADAGAAGWTALSDTPSGGAGNTYQVSLIGTATLGTLGANSTAIINRPAAGNQLATPTIGPSGAQQHTLPAVASDILALLAAAQTLTNKTLGAGTVYNLGVLNAAGTQQAGWHMVTDTVTLAGGTATVTLAGAAVFTSASSYSCVAVDDTGTNPVKVTQTSGSSITFTGTGTDVVRYICIGN